MFALIFTFPARCYHATPWGEHNSERGVAWPPEPWRILRTLISVYWTKGDKNCWSKDSLEALISKLAETLPSYSLPKDTTSALTESFMPDPKKKSKTLVSDASIRLSDGDELAVVWPKLELEDEMFELATHLANAIGYLGRSESWAECKASDTWEGVINFFPKNVKELYKSDVSYVEKYLLTPMTPADYRNFRIQLIKEIQIAEGTSKSSITRYQKSKLKDVEFLPEKFVDVLSISTSDYRKHNWGMPPASAEVLYCGDKKYVLGATFKPKINLSKNLLLPTVARYILAGRPRPRLEDAVKIGEIMHRAAISKFCSSKYEGGSKVRHIPREISGRDENGDVIKDPSHPHAFWLSEDADSDGFIDHISVFISGGIGDNIQAHLDCITKIWLPRKEREWRLALEGFARPKDFPMEGIFGISESWQSVTPFMASGHFQKSKDRNEQYRTEIVRLIKKRGLDQCFGFDADRVDVEVLPKITVGSAERRAIQFHRFRSKGGEAQPDTFGALLNVIFPKKIQGPIALGYGSHFGLGLFSPAR